MLITIEVHVIILEDLNLITKAKIIALVRVMIRVEYNVTINLIITTWILTGWIGDPLQRVETEEVVCIGLINVAFWPVVLK